MPAQPKTTFQFFWRDRSVNADFASGVSLHSHTMYSEESLDSLPRYTEKVPIVRRALAENVDYARAFWTPPLSPRQAHRLEEKQIQRQFHLPALVSLTDHDNIKAGSLLRVLDRFQHAPISTEWTIPFGGTFFHLGVHNLPPSLAPELMKTLAGYTAEPNQQLLSDCLRTLNSFPDTLLILNHPLWDEKAIGASAHEAALLELLKLNGHRFHALELNGLRPWSENHNVIALGDRVNLPLVSGGDRHGREPNAILNLSRGGNLVEFIHELRYDRRSHVVFMPQYHHSLTLRTIHTVIDVLRTYPEVFEGRRTWPERVFYRQPDTDEAVSLASIWPAHKQPRIFKAVSLATRLAQTWGVQSVLRLTFNDRNIQDSGSESVMASRSLPKIERKAVI